MNWMQSSWISDDRWNSYINSSTDWLETTCNVVRKSCHFACSCWFESDSRGNHSKFKSQANGQFTSAAIGHRYRLLRRKATLHTIPPFFSPFNPFELWVINRSMHSWVASSGRSMHSKISLIVIYRWNCTKIEIKWTLNTFGVLFKN